MEGEESKLMALLSTSRYRYLLITTIFFDYVYRHDGDHFLSNARSRPGCFSARAKFLTG